MASADTVAQDNDADAPKVFDFDTVLTTDLLTNTRGGLKRGTMAIYNLDLTGAWKGTHGWEGFVYVEATGNDGFSDRYVGDAQVVSNIDLPPGIRLSEAWIRKTSEKQHFVSTLGFVNVNDMFDVQDVAALFLNASHGIGIDFAQSGASGKPISAFGLVQEWHPSDTWRLRAGVFDALGGDPNHDSVFAAARFSARIGLQYQVEVEKDFDGGYVKLGHWSNSVAAAALDGVSAPQKYFGTYATLSSTLYKEKDHGDQGLKGWIRLGTANAHVLDFDRYVGTGLVYTGLIKGRDDDQVGIAMASGRFGRPYRATVDEPVSTETSYELSYQYEVKPGFVVQPDLQYVRHPSGLSSLGDALVAGIHLRVGLDAIRHGV